MSEHPTPQGHSVDAADDYSVYQTSTISALLAGVFDGDLTIAQLLEHGDFGLGTFNHLDGEMVVLDGVCYHLRSDDTVTVATGAEQTPFAAVTHFHVTSTFEVSELTSIAELESQIDRVTGGENAPVAVRIDGTFAQLRTRTVGEQHQPYPSLVEASAHEVVNTLTDTTGTVAGFRTPQFEQAISVAGYHLHYVDDARRHGGHILDLALASGRVSISPVTELRLSLPSTAAFTGADLDPDDLADQVRRAEG